MMAFHAKGKNGLFTELTTRLWGRRREPKGGSHACLISSVIQRPFGEYSIHAIMTNTCQDRVAYSYCFGTSTAYTVFYIRSSFLMPP